MAKKVYISEIFASAFYEKVVKASREMTTAQIYKELGHVKSLSQTNCGWGEYEIRNVVIKYLEEKISEREYHAAQQKRAADSLKAGEIPATRRVRKAKVIRPAKSG